MTTDSPLRSRLRAALLQARRDGDAEATSALRTALSALENAEAVPVDKIPRAGAVEDALIGAGSADAERRTLSDADEEAIVAAEISALIEAAKQYDAIAPERAAAARISADLVTRVLGQIETYWPPAED